MRPRTVVTGAAGFIGSHLVESLLGAGHPVVGIDSFNHTYSPARKRANIEASLRHPRFQLLTGDLTELALEDVLRTGDLVFHLAAHAGVRQSWGEGFAGYLRDNVMATQRVLEACRRAGVGRVVYASSSSVYGDAPLPMAEDGPLRPVSPYGVTKLSAEQLGHVYWRNFGLDVVPLRFFTVYGPRQRPDMAFSMFIDAVSRGRPVTAHGSGEQRRDFTYVADVVDVLVAAAHRGQPGVPVNVAAGSSVTVLDAVDIIGELIGRRPEVELRPSPPGDARDTEASTERLRDLMIRQPTSIREGLRRQVEWQTGGNPQRRLTEPRSRDARGGGRRLFLYSHDTYGLGHLRRNLAISHALLGADPRLRVTLATGSRVAREWPRPRGVELVQLPPAVKVGDDRYGPVGGRDMACLVAERSGTLMAAVRRALPDVLLVDHSPLGMHAELLPCLEMVSELMPRVRRVLGLRDILDEPEVVRRRWREQDVYSALDRLYDDILVYGCRQLFDVGHHYALPEGIARRTRFVGYVAKDRALEPSTGGGGAEERWRAASPRLLVLGGGGGDAAALFEAVLDSWPDVVAAAGGRTLLVTGPLMEEATLRELGERAGRLPGVDLVRFSRNVLTLVDECDAVVCMGGYNSVVECLSARRPFVVCPRVHPRREQLIRATLVEGLGLARVHRLDESGAGGLSRRVLAALSEPPPPDGAWEQVDLEGGRRIAETLLATPPALAA